MGYLSPRTSTVRGSRSGAAFTTMNVGRWILCLSGSPIVAAGPR